MRNSTPAEIRVGIPTFKSDLVGAICVWVSDSPLYTICQLGDCFLYDGRFFARPYLFPVDSIFTFPPEMWTLLLPSRYMGAPILRRVVVYLYTLFYNNVALRTFAAPK